MTIYRKVRAGVSGRDAMVVGTVAPGYGGPVKEGRTIARPVAPGYGGGSDVSTVRVEVPGYGSVPAKARLSAITEVPDVAPFTLRSPELATR